MKHVCPIEARTRRGSLRYLDDLRLLAKHNREEPTFAEDVFWKKFLKRDKTGWRFLRQKPIGRFIVDFYCSKLLLVIEVDGEYHNQKQYRDAEREKLLEQRGIVTIRFCNGDVLYRQDKVGGELMRAIEDRVSLSSKGEAAKPRGI